METKNKNESIEKEFEKEKKLATISVIFWIVLIVIAICIAIYYGYRYVNTITNTLHIINIDGIAYIEIDDNITRLLDENGRQVVYTEEVKNKAEKSLYWIKKEVDGTTMYIVHDKETSMYYIGFEDLTNSNDILNIVNIMYNKDKLKIEGK